MTVEKNKVYNDVKPLAQTISNIHQQCFNVANALASFDSYGFVDEDGNRLSFPSGGWKALITRFENLVPACEGLAKSALSAMEAGSFGLADPPQFDGHDLETEIQEFMKEAEKEEKNALEMSNKFQKLGDDISPFTHHFDVLWVKAQAGAEIAQYGPAFSSSGTLALPTRKNPTKEQFVPYGDMLANEKNTVFSIASHIRAIADTWTVINLDMRSLHETLWAQLKDGPVITKSFFKELKVAKEIYGPLRSLLTSYVNI
ncbi:hypothetical protein B0H16DRAFT_1699950 [Mycena metata]|uniref:Uncharacterized protein n=1 Tax=Mycena metata TaxID=1033252 RepID=A0AAD7HGX8_9AGAR|nr:hypothetical protein B0H16DRAFT_1699950 [Mycena metata]